MPKFRLLLVAATPFEIAPLINQLAENYKTEEDGTFSKGNLSIQILVTGVGMTHTAYFLGRVMKPDAFNFALNAGIAGAFNRNLKIGDVVNVATERFGDLGVEEADGTFTDIHQMGLMDGDTPPFQFGILSNPGAADFSFLPSAHGLTVNKVHGYEKSIEAIHQKYSSDIESMEGAAFFLASLYAGIPFLSIRSISNYVEKRNREAWDLPKAIETLNKVLSQIIESISESAGEEQRIRPFR